MVRQEIYGYLLTHYAISALICHAATEADIDPDRVKFLCTVGITRRRAADPAFPPEQQQRSLAAVMADITSPRNLNPRRHHRSYLRVIKRPAQLLPGQTATRHRHPPPRPAHSLPRQPQSPASNDQLKLSGIDSSRGWSQASTAQAASPHNARASLMRCFIASTMR